MWIVRLALRASLHFAVFALLTVDSGAALDYQHPNRHFPQYRYPGSQHRLAIQRPIRCGYGQPHHHHHRTHADHHGRQYRSPRVPIARRRGSGEGLLSTEGNAGHGHCTNHSRFADQLRQLPQGTTPPLVITYTASSVPILQLGSSGQGLSEQQLNDFGLNFIRTQFATVEGAESPILMAASSARCRWT